MSWLQDKPEYSELDTATGGIEDGVLAQAAKARARQIGSTSFFKVHFPIFKNHVSYRCQNQTNV